jgi:hypothetical protein
LRMWSMWSMWSMSQRWRCRITPVLVVMIIGCEQ